MIYTNLMATTNQKPAKDTHKIKRKEPKQNTKENQQTTRDEGTDKNYKNKQKTINKMTISTYLLIITLNVKD